MYIVDNSGAESITLHAGFPNAAADSRLTGLDLNQLLIKRPVSTYIFRIRGESWQERGVFDGDLAIVDRAAPLTKSCLALTHDGENFQISHAGRLTKSDKLWGVVTAIIHQY